MKAIIGGKRYDTETATEIASDGNNLGRGDFGFVDETLYRTQKGAWFMVGEGGANTRYAVTVGNGRTGGSRIIVLSSDEAREWLEASSQPSALEALEKYFPVEDA